MVWPTSERAETRRDKMASPERGGDPEVGGGTVGHVGDARTPTSASDDARDRDEQTALEGLTENVRDQDDLERDITFQANLALIDVEDKRDHRRIEKLEARKAKLDDERRKLQGQR